MGFVFLEDFSSDLIKDCWMPLSAEQDSDDAVYIGQTRGVRHCVRWVMIDWGAGH